MRVQVLFDRCSMLYPYNSLSIAYTNWFTLSTYFLEGEFSPTDWISQAEAARLRGVTRQAIARLVERGRLRAMTVGGHTFVCRADVEAFAPRPAGRPKDKTTT